MCEVPFVFGCFCCTFPCLQSLSCYFQRCSGDARVRTDLSFKGQPGPTSTSVLRCCPYDLPWLSCLCFNAHTPLILPWTVWLRTNNILMSIWRLKQRSGIPSELALRSSHAHVPWPHGATWRFCDCHEREMMSQFGNIFFVSNRELTARCVEAGVTWTRPEPEPRVAWPRPPQAAAVRLSDTACLLHVAKFGHICYVLLPCLVQFYW